MPNVDSSFVRVELPPRALNPRHFIYTSALAANSLAASSYGAPRARLKTPNEKLDMAAIGIAGKNAPEANQYIHGQYRKGWSV